MILTLVAFFAPAAVLSAVTPLVVKVRLVSLDQTGEVVGSFSAVGTAGALVGTFVTGFVLLTAFPSRPVVLVVGLVLVAIGVWLHLKYRSGSLGPTVGGAGLAALGLVLAPGPCQWETSYSCASVLVDQDNASGRTLQLDLLAHSYVDLDDPTNLKFRYTREFAAAVEATAKAGPVNTLGIGGGGFTMPRYFAATRPGSVHTVFEIDDSLVDIAIEELGLDPAAIDLTVETSDARLGLARRSNADVGSGTEFDVVVGDAFGGLSVPWHLTTLEFLELLKTSMAPDGVYVMNLIDYPDHRFLRAEIATLQRVFDDVALIVPEEALAGTSGGNSVVVASDVTIDELALADALQQWDSDSVISSGAGLEKFVGNARVLTDDFAPVDQIIDAPVGKG